MADVALGYREYERYRVPKPMVAPRGQVWDYFVVSFSELPYVHCSVRWSGLLLRGLALI